MRLSRRLRTALGSLVVDYRTLVQLVFCVSVYGRLFAVVFSPAFVAALAVWWNICGGLCGGRKRAGN